MHFHFGRVCSMRMFIRNHLLKPVTMLASLNRNWHKYNRSHISHLITIICNKYVFFSFIFLRSSVSVQCLAISLRLMPPTKWQSTMQIWSIKLPQIRRNITGLAQHKTHSSLILLDFQDNLPNHGQSQTQLHMSPLTAAAIQHSSSHMTPVSQPQPFFMSATQPGMFSANSNLLFLRGSIAHFRIFLILPNFDDFSSLNFIAENRSIDLMHRRRIATTRRNFALSDGAHSQDNMRRSWQRYSFQNVWTPATAHHAHSHHHHHHHPGPMHQNRMHQPHNVPIQTGIINSGILLNFLWVFPEYKKDSLNWLLSFFVDESSNYKGISVIFIHSFAVPCSR